MQRIRGLLFPIIAVLAVGYGSGFFGCANPLPLTGGDQDTIPPRLLGSIPLTGTTHFQSRRLELFFSKPIQANNLREQLLIAPRTQARWDFHYRIRGSKLILLLKDSLRSETTYTVNADRAIKDLHEGLAAENASFAFSTGERIDSLFIQGRIWNPYAPLQAAQTPTSYRVGLTSDLRKDSLWNRDYEYLTQSDTSGGFRIPYLSAGQYLLHAFEDKNRNGRLDAQTEAHGFVAGNLSLDSATQGLLLPILPSNIQPLNLLGIRSLGHYAEANYSKAITRAVIRTSPKPIHHQYVNNQKNIRFYAPDTSDSLKIVLQVYDALGQTRIDTLSLGFGTAYLKPKPLSFSLSTAPLPQFYGNSITWHCAFNKPIRAFQADSIYRIHTDSTRIAWQKPTWEWNETREVLHIHEKVNSKTQHVGLYIGRGAFISIENDTTQTKYLFSQRIKEEAFGRMKGHIQVDSSLSAFPLLVHLINPEQSILRSTQYPAHASTRSFDWRWIPPGKYFIRLIVDQDNNGQWTPGSLPLDRPHEKVLLYPQPITVRANWWMERMNIRFP